MRWGFHFCVVVVFLAMGNVVFAEGAAVPANIPAARTGSFETTFTQRSPSSEMSSLTRRLKFEGAATDYDLSKQAFLVYVPPAYVPEKPMGLLVLLNYKVSDTLPVPLLPELAAANMAF